MSPGLRARATREWPPGMVLGFRRRGAGEAGGGRRAEEGGEAAAARRAGSAGPERGDGRKELAAWAAGAGAPGGRAVGKWL